MTYLVYRVSLAWKMSRGGCGCTPNVSRTQGYLAGVLGWDSWGFTHLYRDFPQGGPRWDRCTSNYPLTMINQRLNFWGWRRFFWIPMTNPWGDCILTFTFKVDLCWDQGFSVHLGEQTDFLGTSNQLVPPQQKAAGCFLEHKVFFGGAAQKIRCIRKGEL